MKPSLFSLGIIVATLCCLDTARAQSNALVATPQQLTFYTQTGVTSPPQSILISSESGAVVNFTVAAVSDSNWLTVTPLAGSTSAVLSVSIGAGAPTSGVDVGFVNVTSSSGTISIPVTLNANFTAASQPISANPNSLSFVFSSGNSPATTQSVALSSSSAGVTNFTATPLTSNGGPWLNVNPTAGSFPGTLLVTVNPATLGSNPGTFNGAVTINSPGANGFSIPVLVTIQGVPSLSVSPAKLSFAYQLGAALPAAETLTISSSTGASVTFDATAMTNNCGNWIVLNQNNGATPSTLSVQVNTSGLMAGPCTGAIDITAPSAANANISVPVSLLVSTLPLIQAPATGPAFTYQIGGAIPGPQNVQVTSSTTGVSISTSVTPANEGPNFLLVTPATGTTSQALTLTLSPDVLQNLAPGTYTDIVTVSSTEAGNSPQAFPVTLTVSSNPTLIANVQSLNFNYQVGQVEPPSQAITITSTGAPLNYQVSTATTNCTGFLKATPAGGSTFGNQNQIVVSVITQGITPQVCSGTITLTVPGSTAAPLVIPVTSNVSNTALLSVSQPAINVVAVAGAAATTQTVSVTSTSGTSIGFSATAATNPVGLTWLAVTPNAGNTPNNLQVTINPANLGVGTYPGSITVTSSVLGIPSQTIPVTLTVVSSIAMAGTPSLTFTQAAGGTAPASQTVLISGVPAGATIGAISTLISGTGWLSATTSGNAVTVTANGSQLGQDSYSGVVTVIIPGAGGSPIYIPVTLNVTPAASAIAVSNSMLSFNVVAGSASVPNSQSVQVTSATGTSVPFTAAFIPSAGVNFLTITPTSGNTPGTLNLSVNSAISSTLAAGSYPGQVQVSSGTGAVQTINVTLVVNPAGTPVVSSITSGGSLQSGAVSPGEIVSIFGNSFGPAMPSSGTSFTPTASDTVATTLAGVTVTFNGVPAPLLFVDQGQINAVVPYEVAGQTSVPVVVTNGATSATFTVPVAPAAPAIFSSSENGNGQGAILNFNDTVNSANNPAAPGSVISIYATGEGQIVPAGTTGCITGTTLPLPQPVTTPVLVTIGGEPAAISYAGEAPGLVCGVIQINATIPSDLNGGPQPVVLTIGTANNNSQKITVAVN